MTKARELAELGKAVSVHDNRLDFDRSVVVPGLIDSSGTTTIADGSVTTAKIADDAVTDAKFQHTPTFTGELTAGNFLSSSNTPRFTFNDLNNSTDNKKLQVISGSDGITFQALNDANSGGGDLISIRRSGNNITGMMFVDNGNDKSFIACSGNVDNYINNGGNLGIGIASPDGTLHVHSASAGSVTATSDGDDLVVENSGNGGINILTPDANRSALFFGHASDNNKMQIRHDGATSLSQIISDDTLTFNVSGGTERMRINDDGNVLLGRTSELLDFGDGRTSLVLQGSGSQDYSTIQLGNNGTGSNNQILGLLGFFDGTNENARIQGQRGSGTDVGDLLFFTRSSGGSLTEAMRVYRNGNVGIGTSEPTAPLHVISGEIGNGSNKGIKIANHNSSKVYSIRTGITGSENTSLSIYDDTAGASRITVNTSGHVMIGTTTEGNASADDLTVAGSGNTGITVRAGTSNSSAIYFSDATSGAAEYSGFFDYAHGTDKLSIGVNQSTKLSIDANGNVVKDNNPSFRAVGTTASYITTSPVQFNSVTGSGNHNTGNHYNTSTYRFTAPVAGRYLFHVHMGIVRVTVNGGHGYPYLRINAVSLAYSYVHVPTATSYTPANITQVFQLAANDYVDVIYGGLNSGYYGNHTELSFSGYLLG